MFDMFNVKGKFSLGSIFRNRRYLKNDFYENPYRFRDHGVVILCGELGSGKSLTASRLIQTYTDIYPDLKVCSNVDLHFLDESRIFPFVGLDGFLKYDNGDRGIILYIDEIVNQFPSSLSKDISDGWVTFLSLIRKMRVLLIGTGPKFSRLAKPFRERFDYVCVCEGSYQYFEGHLFQNNYWYRCNLSDKILGDGDTETTHNMDLVKHQIFTIDPKDYERYNSFELVKIIDTEDRRKKK